MSLSLQMMFFFSIFLMFTILSINTVFAVVEDVPSSKMPIGVSVNSNTDRIYVSNYDSGTISVIDGSTNTVLSNVTVGYAPSAIAVNPNTNTIYVAYHGLSGSQVAIIDGMANKVIKTIQISLNDINGLAVNPNTNRIYVGYGNYPNGAIFVIDGSSNKLMDKININNTSEILGVNPSNNKLYMYNGEKASILVVDGSTYKVLDKITSIYNVYGLAVNPVTNKIYAVGGGNFPQGAELTLFGYGEIYVIDGYKNIIINDIKLKGSVGGVAIDTSLNQIYVTGSSTKSVSIINGYTNNVTANVNVGGSPEGIDVNQVTHKVYVANSGSNTVSIISGMSQVPEFPLVQIVILASIVISIVLYRVRIWK